MKVGVLGSGDVGRTLGGGFVRQGHGVMVGTRDAGKLRDWAAKHAGAQVGTFAEAAGFGELVVLAVKGTAAAAALRAAGAENLKAKVVMDACNPIADAAPVNGVLKFFTNLDESLMEKLQKEFPAARFVKAFNSVGAGRMVHPKYAEGVPTMFICGNDAAAKEVARGVVKEFGWEAADMGGAEAARAIEPLCMLWCIRGLREGKWDHAFKLLVP